MSFWGVIIGLGYNGSWLMFEGTCSHSFIYFMLCCLLRGQARQYLGYMDKIGRIFICSITELINMRRIYKVVCKLNGIVT